ncbi:hypothetical protein FACS189451_04230 [Bacteroidia bacterium]|nr:hypothetical protein FACS189451_04230 [Bacteroidia bacterium]
MKNTLKFIAVLLIVLFNLSDTQAQNATYFKGGNLHILNSSHQDIAWMDTPEACIRFRDENEITPALERMRANKDFCFDVEDALSLREYLERHPDLYGEILQYTREGRLGWGATNKQPYQSMYDGEAREIRDMETEEERTAAFAKVIGLGQWRY